jgi:hypothetical protein
MTEQCGDFCCCKLVVLLAFVSLVLRMSVGTTVQNSSVCKRTIIDDIIDDGY